MAVTPAPFLLGTWGQSTNATVVYKAALAALMAKLATGVAMTMPQQEAAFTASVAAFVLIPTDQWIIPPGFMYANTPAYQYAYAQLIGALSKGTKMSQAAQQAYLSAAIAAYPALPKASAVLAWQNPATSTGSNIYQGGSPGSLVKVATVAGVSAWTSPPLAPGVYYFAVTNLAPAESAMSPVVSLQVGTGNPAVASVPSILGITVTLT